MCLLGASERNNPGGAPGAAEPGRSFWNEICANNFFATRPLQRGGGVYFKGAPVLNKIKEQILFS